MVEEKEKKGSDFSFIQETIKQKRFYQNKVVRRIAWTIGSGVLFALTALGVLAVFLPKLYEKPEPEVLPITIPKEEEVAEETDSEDDVPVYITETISMELEDYKKMYQQLMQIGNQVEKSLVNVSAVTVDTDWFDETYISQSSVCGVLIGDNGLELLILADYGKVEHGESLQVSFLTIQPHRQF